ncbi:MAG: MFS transporter [Myxococcota bacterium]
MESRETEKRTLAICAITHVVQDGVSAMLYVLAPVLAGALGLNYAQVGMIKATRSAASSLLELPSGLLAERFGERRLLGFGLLCSGAGYLLLSQAESFAPLLLCIVIAGVGGAFQHALSSSLLSQTHGDGTRLSALGLYNSAGDAGKLLFTAMFGVLIGAGLAWNSIVAAFGGIALLLSALVYFGLKRLGVGGVHPRDPQGEGDADPSEAAQGWGIQDRGGFFAVCASISLDTCVQSGFLVFLPFLFAEKGITTAGISFAVVLTLLGGIFGKAGCGYLAQRLGVRASLSLIQIATAAGIAALLVAPGQIAFFVLPVLGLFLQGSTSITYGAVSDLFTRRRQSRGFGLVYSLSSIAGVFGPVLFGLAGDAYGLRVSAAMMILLSLLAIPPVFFFRSRRPA